MVSTKLFRYVYEFAIATAVLLLVFFAPSCEKTSHNQQILQSQNILIFAPHPDDEVLGFAGIIYEAIQLGKNVKVIIVTNGDGYRSAAYLWKNGCPKEETACSGSDPTEEEMEDFGDTRVEESKRALSLLGLHLSSVSVLGYPDGRLREMYHALDTVVQGNTTRSVSFTGKHFTGHNLKEDVKSILRNNPNASVFVTHIRDHHADHASLAGFVQLARAELRSENLSFETYWSIIHEPDRANDNLWPSPVCDWTARRGEVLKKREVRYRPALELQPPRVITEAPLRFRMKDELWSPTAGKPPLMRKAIDTYRTQIGMVRSNGDPLMPGYEGWVDFSGYAISFVKRNHLLWKAPLPEQPSFKSDPGESGKSAL